MKRLSRILFIIAVGVFAFSACAFVGCKPEPEKPASASGVSSVVTEQPTETEKPVESEQEYYEEITEMFISINGKRAEITLAKNATLAALVERLKNGDITYTADDYGGFEKVGSGLGFDLPTSDERITTKPGDVVLYAGDKIVVFYGSNTWSYTRLGRIEGYSVSQLREFLAVGTNGVTVTLSLT